MKRSLVVLLVGLVVLSGCATLNKEECLTADWYQIGYEDGARGYPDTRISSHREACAKHGIAPDFRAYQDGHEEGVIRFCTPRNGFEQGKKGYNYSGICPPSLEDGFLDGYDAGREIYAVTSAIRSLQSEQNGNESKMESLQNQIIEKTNLMLADETTIDDRYRLNQEIAQMQQDLGGLEQRNKQLVVELAEAQARLRILNEKYAYF
ncbi:DUF2799 domain-containing protein [Reinekea sp. G2M2-21]|uniref:DUF2799 domain-containing protein n=1 Tax=Reinekea sp. G2M2-21 TaxID=2788942 RepID=UPI0018A91BFD|nr:DUF2799 domain-containing protein [Reinekea sp. G2M2-21]